MFLVLALIVGAIYGIFALIKRFNRNSTAQSPRLRVLASAGLGTGKAVHVVQAGKQAFLIGAGDQAVSLVAELADKEYIDQLVLEAETRPQRQRADFPSLLSGLLGRPARGKGGLSSSSSFLDALGKQRERIKKL